MAVTVSVFGFFNIGTDVDHAIAHWGCTGTIRESALEVVSGRRKKKSASGTRTRVNIAPGFSVGRSALPAELCLPQI